VDVLVADVAEVLRSLREQSGFTRQALADLSGLSISTLKLIEYGESPKPKPDTLRMLAKGLATNRLTQRVDREQCESIYAQLMTAADYVQEPPEPHEGPTEIPDDIRDQVLELVGTDEGLTRAILEDLARRPDENRRAALRFLAQALTLSRTAAPNRRRGGARNG
jgi:transcriptional regulator with XRE-family HTH domain